ncbi:hypothetical protein CERZMDRAFT_89316 [Cercospora zeae-maydis SCOH1-5]|uniref:Zn(2)-C6 fungal-type domain-containing protein n=1 Tax=Cercospora zeae-maydis SCOH1-5 TaxID=717836 RepID=A0A6A6F1N1_9PEZI|nr:hypothetical protein CERZMDRAFT_89316 [Cercospora zeae-maydis SCOH1-5]
MHHSQQQGMSGPSDKQQRIQLPPGAPIDGLSSSKDRRASASSSSPSSSSKGRTARLSHRSRAGCWTCRSRKVKCDEAHPRCGQCTRLNRKCDWNFRWNFTDATTNTQTRFSNVKTEGNVVWDPAVSSPTSSYTHYSRDDLPAFSELTSEEDRERKAEAHKPGTFGVIVTPESFHDLPEYTNSSQGSPNRRRTRTHSCRSGQLSPRPAVRRATTLPPDHNMIILDRFEDAASDMVMPTRSSLREEIPEALQNLSITSPPYTPSATSTAATASIREGEELVSHFRQYIVPRLIHPQFEALPGVVSRGSTSDVLEREAARFPPLRHALCAISALNLAYTGRSSLEEAMQNYHQALAASSASSIANDLLSDGVFFRHYLLFVYDICVPMPSDELGSDMWAKHLTQLQRIAVQRHHHHGGQELHAYTIWNICELDVYACLMGSGTCEFLRTIIQNNMLPPLSKQVPSPSTGQSPDLGPHNAQLFSAILRLNEGVLLRAAIIAQTAKSCRAGMAIDPGANILMSPGRLAHWSAIATQAQNDLLAFWQHAIPPQLASDSTQHQIPAETLALLPERARSVFESARLLYHAMIIYSRTSMFRGQRQVPTATQLDITSDTERRIVAILALASQQIDHRQVERRNTVFAVFIAGVASHLNVSKVRAIEIVREYEGFGIGQNTTRTRQLLVEVREEQRRVVAAGGRIEDVEWLAVARERGLGVANCGL